MPDTSASLDLVLALRDTALPELPMADVDARVLAALEREIEREARAAPRRPGAPGGHRPAWGLTRRGRRRVRVLIALMAVLALAGAGYAALSPSPQLSAGIDCHAEATLSGDATIVGLDGRVATQVCAALWAQGQVGRARTPPAPLHSCVQPSGGGAIQVVPSGDANVCAQLGLREDSAAGASATARHYASFSQRLTRWLDRTACPSDQQVRREVDSAMSAAGLSGWSVGTRGGFSTQAPCASVAIDSTARTVTILAEPR